MANNVQLNGATLFLDPAWQAGVGIEGASSAVVNFTGNRVDGRVVAGQNSLAVLGDVSTDWAMKTFNDTKLGWGPGAGNVTAALAVRSPVVMDATQGGIKVDGSVTMNSDAALRTVGPNQAIFAPNSLLMVDAANLGQGQAAVTSSDGNGEARVAATSVLYVANAQVGSETAILKGFNAAIEEGGWKNSVTSTDAMMRVSLKNVDRTVSVTAQVDQAQNALPGVMPVNIMNRIWAADGLGVNGNGQGVNNTESENAGIAFLSKAVDKRYVAADDTVRTLNGAAQMAVAAGVQSSTIQASDSVNRALLEHLSLSNAVTEPDGSAVPREGIDLWASVLYRDTDSSGIRAGRFNADYENDFGGILVGSDYTWKDTGNGSLRAGGALSIGKGEGKSHGDFNYTKNDYDTYGVSAYGSWKRQATQLIVDVGYVKGDNEVKQSLPGALGGKLKAELDTQVWTIGAQGEQRLRTEALDVTPHIGVRYLRLKTDAFSTHNEQGTVFRTESDTQNVWQLPIGVTLSRNYVAENGWTVKPKLDVSVIPVGGDRDAKTKITVPGVGASDMATTEIMDSTAWSGALGVEVMKDRTRFGVRVGYQKSDDARSRGAMLTVGHQFE